ncbi:hypothetical protein FOA52_010270 [Chlamydomonas sp. UWO 241]|nr:hypothetical protein FOA52_010270 [Chlamydomonas sp. UWO 241]
MPYDNPLVMSLAEFVKHPIATELVHNGQAYQVLGITNYSHWRDARELRACIESDALTREHMLDAATARVSKFLHVGSTGRLAESIAAAGASMGFRLHDTAINMAAIRKVRPRGGVMHAFP